LSEYTDAWSKSDMTALLELYTTDAVIVTIDGKTYKGKDGIRAYIEPIMKMGSTKLLLKDASILSVKDNTATVSGKWVAIGTTNSGENVDLNGVYNNIMVKENGKMKIANTVYTNLVKTIVTHKVADWEKWKAGFESFKKIRREAGELSFEIGTLNNNPSTVYVINEWASVEAAKAFFANPKLAEAMKNAGVLEAPHFMILDKK